MKKNKYQVNYLPLFYDVTGDGYIDKVYATGRESMDGDSGYINITVNGVTYSEENWFFDYDATLVHTADGKNYIYYELLRENDYREIVCYDLESEVKKVGSVDGGLRMIYHEGGEVLITQDALTNPERFYLQQTTQHLSTVTGYKAYHAGDNGVPVSDDKMFTFDEEKMTEKEYFELNKDNDVKAIFQCGTLIIDQRACKFCMRVNDTGKHSASAAPSGMYLVYCDCTTKTKPAKLQIVAAVTVGDIGALAVGKNGVFYDNSGLEWDAVITKIVDNPINISQSFWSPYRRMATAIENLINKSAADKDSKIMAKATAEINAAPNKTIDDKTAAATPPFDIAKFAGIFAAIGMAVGMIGTALASIFKGLFALSWWQLILVFVCILLVISGPAMIMAWLKLRRRNIAPLLNANGWAVNAASKISIPFGETLTDIAVFPHIKLKDPYAKKGLKAWQKWFISIICTAFVVFVMWLFNIFSPINPKLLL